MILNQIFTEGLLHNAGQEDNPVASAITRRIIMQRTDLLAKYGPELVGQAIDEVADFVGDAEEIGSSDVSGWVRHVEQMLGNNPPEAFAEAEDAVVHRIGLTVTDPNHPMVSKRKETIQKTVRVTGGDRDSAVNQAIASYRRKGYKVHDHHYIGTVSEAVTENYPKHQDLSGVSTDKLKAYLARQGQQAVPGEGSQVKRVQAELQRRSQGVAEGSSTNAEVTKRAKAAAQKAGKTFNTDVEYRLWYAITTQANAATRKADKKQGMAEGVAETMTMDDAMKVLRHYGAGHFKTTSNELHFYKNGQPFNLDLIWNDDATRSVSISQLNSATRQLKGQDMAEEVDTGQYDARKSNAKGATTPEQEKEFRKKVQAYGKELEQRQKEKVKGVAEGSKEKTPGVALSKAYQKDFDSKKPVNRRPETALTGTYSKTGKPGGELKKQGVAEGSEQRWRVTVGNKSGTLSHTKTFTGTKEQAIKQAVTRFATTKNPVVTAELVKQDMAEGAETPEKELERLKLRQDAEHGRASLKRQSDTQARIRELEKQIKGQQDVAEAGPYGSRNPDLMTPQNYDRYQQDQMDYNKRAFKRDELEQELGNEEEYYRQQQQRDAGTWYIRINGKVLKDKQGNPYTFRGKAAANKAAVTMMQKPFNAGKKFMLTTNLADT